MDEIKDLMYKSEKYTEEIDELQRRLSELKDSHEEVSRKIHEYFICCNFYNGVSYSILNTPENRKLIKDKCSEKNINYNISIGTGYYYSDWSAEEYKKFIKKHNIEKLLKYIEKYTPPDETESDDD